MNYEIDKTGFLARLQVLMGKKKPYSWAKEIGLAAPTFNRVWKKGGQFKSAQLTLIKEKTGVSLDWLLSGKESVCLSGDQIRDGDISIYRIRERRADEPLDVSFVENASGYLSVPVIGGGVAADNSFMGGVAFREEWIRAKGDPQNMSIMRVEGDAMWPTLQAGDVVLINRNVHKVGASGGIYAISLGGEVTIRRAQVLLPAGKIKVTSDNEEYEESTVDADQLTINGKVIWFARDLER